MLLDFITWNVDPVIFDLGFVAPRWYGLLFAGSFFFGYILMDKFFKKEGLAEGVLDTITTYMLVATVIGARLGHILFYQPDYYFAHPIEMLYIWEGGLASHGAAVGILFGLYIFSKKQKLNLLWVYDRIAIVVALSGFLIRTGNLMNSEIYGHITDLPWGFKFIRDFPVGAFVEPRHPTQIYEALSYLAIFGYMLSYYYKKDGKTPNGYLFGIFMTGVFGMRFIIEFLKENQVSFEQNMNLNMGQWLSIPLVIIGIYFIWRSKNASTKRN
ncbi:MAG: prolipoprotein diacylglyceryl transferase [Bacteroidetes bacterium 4572_77]|nr:MAG: prolipoprotein diacylglyceryl transferase [Bacteroidetes bacterium 4572_77]